MKLRHLWEVVRSGYWFVPGLMTLAAVGLAAAMLLVDRRVLRPDQGDRGLEAWFYAGGAEGARALLSTIASSLITVAGVVFSITIAALTQASSQFGPRLLRNFMRDRGNQVVLGAFVATFVYCLLILRTVWGDEGEGFVPQASVTVGVLLAVVSVAVLIYFIHHVSVSLQAPQVVAAVAADLAEAIGRLERERPARGGAADPTQGDPFPESQAAAVTAPRDGYVQTIDYATLLKRATAADVRMRVACRPGDYLIEGNPWLWVWPAHRCPQGVAEELRRSLILGSQRTPEQDLEHMVRQLVEIAIRALSPGVNDPFTAVNCVDALGAALSRVARHRLPPPAYADEQGRLRLVARVITMEGLIDAAFDQIRQHARRTPAVLIRMLEVFAAVAPRLNEEAQRRSLLRHAEMVHRDGQDAIPQEQDRRDLRRRYEEAVAALNS